LKSESPTLETIGHLFALYTHITQAENKGQAYDMIHSFLSKSGNFYLVLLPNALKKKIIHSDTDGNPGGYDRHEKDRIWER
jgi:hypothetical protein